MSLLVNLVLGIVQQFKKKKMTTTKNTTFYKQTLNLSVPPAFRIS